MQFTAVSCKTTNETSCYSLVSSQTTNITDTLFYSTVHYKTYTCKSLGYDNKLHVKLTPSYSQKVYCQIQMSPTPTIQWVLITNYKGNPPTGTHFVRRLEMKFNPVKYWVLVYNKQTKIANVWCLSQKFKCNSSHSFCWCILKNYNSTSSLKI